MKTPAKALLAFSIVTFTASLLPVLGDFWYGVLKPVGALAFIAFFIVNLLSKEMAQLDWGNSSEPVKSPKCDGCEKPQCRQTQWAPRAKAA